MLDLAAARADFGRRFNRPPEVAVRAPGRVNLIGEHTDYNDGFVLPMALDFQLICLAARRADRRVQIYSCEYDALDRFDLDDPTPAADGRWRNYVQGMAWALEARGARLLGCDVWIQGDVPQAAGLSSSAALEMATGWAFVNLSGAAIDRVTLALCGQAAENRFLGVQTGIMDQYISALAQADTALCIDCRTLEATPVPLPLHAQGLAVVVVESGVQRGLVDSEYNARRQECEEGVRRLQALLPDRAISALRDVTPADLMAHSAALPPLILARARHVVTENARVLASVAALQTGDLAHFGALMVESHASMRDDYAITVPAVDRLIDLSLACPGVWGARMTGGGFGGSTVHLVEQTALDRFAAGVVAPYEAATGLRASLYVCHATAGVSLLHET
ncbi:MAG: galactokinase [Chloroflexota bacterium]|nr:galactokinase [Chloroflexota bacterium]